MTGSGMYIHYDTAPNPALQDLVRQRWNVLQGNHTHRLHDEIGGQNLGEALPGDTSPLDRGIKRVDAEQIDSPQNKWQHRRIEGKSGHIPTGCDTASRGHGAQHSGQGVASNRVNRAAPPSGAQWASR